LKNNVNSANDVLFPLNENKNKDLTAEWETTSVLTGSLSMSLNLTEGFTFLEWTIGEERSTWIIHARPVPQDELLNDYFFLNDRSLVPPLIISGNLEPNHQWPQLDLKRNPRVNDLLQVKIAPLKNRLISNLFNYLTF